MYHTMHHIAHPQCCKKNLYRFFFYLWGFLCSCASFRNSCFFFCQFDIVEIWVKNQGSMIAALSKAVGYLCDTDRKGMSSSQGMKGGNLCMLCSHPFPGVPLWQRKDMMLKQIIFLAGGDAIIGSSLNFRKHFTAGILSITMSNVKFNPIWLNANAYAFDANNICICLL